MQCYNVCSKGSSVNPREFQQRFKTSHPHHPHVQVPAQCGEVLRMWNFANHLVVISDYPWLLCCVAVRRPIFQIGHVLVLR